MDSKRIIEAPIVALTFLLVFLYAIFGVQNFFTNQLPASISEPVQNNIVMPEVNAESAISIESNLSGADKIIFEKDGDKKLAIASLTKLMTAIIVLDNYNLSDTAVVDEIADSQEPIKQDVKLGDVMSVENFLYIMLVGSSNKAAYALSELVGEQNFVELMNKKAKNLGMEKTFFADPTGLSPESVSTAKDLAKLAIYISKDYPKIAEMSKVKELYVPRFGNVVNTDELLSEVPNIICSKTGFTDEANGCLLLVIKNPNKDTYLINVVLGANDRFAEMQKLISACK